MGRFDAISTAIRFVFDAVGVQPRPWMGVAAFVLLALLLGPSVKRSLGAARARKLVVSLADLGPEQRQARSAEILSLVDRNPDGLVAIADEAIRRRQEPLAREAYRRLRNSGGKRRDQLRLEEELNGPLPRLVEEELDTLERLIAAGALERADQRLNRARAVFPQEVRLLDVARRIQDARRAG